MLLGVSRMRWTEHVACIKVIRKSESETPLGRSYLRGITAELNCIFEGVDSFRLS
jgi:hypothetical protein